VTEPLLSRAEAAAYLGVSPRVLDGWAYKNEGPPYFKVGRHTRYDRADLLRWLAARRVVPQSARSLRIARAR
jgi:excisionase family DNA binding protein